MATVALGTSESGVNQSMATSGVNPGCRTSSTATIVATVAVATTIFTKLDSETGVRELMCSVVAWGVTGRVTAIGASTRLSIISTLTIIRSSDTVHLNLAVLMIAGQVGIAATTSVVSGTIGTTETVTDVTFTVISRD